MNEQENLQLVKRLHVRGRGQGYMEAVLNELADDVEWWADGPVDILPWAGTHRGREGVANWFKVLNEAMEYQQFDPREFIAQGDTVVVLYHASGRARSTGRSFESDIIRLYTVRDGKLVRVRSYYNTAAYVAALRGA